jgi:hypothetical protein
MRNRETLSLEQIRAFLEVSGDIEFRATRRQEVYEWVTRTLCEQEYWHQRREVNGLLRLYIGKMTGLSGAQVTRLIGRYRETGTVQEKPYRRNRFKEPLHELGCRTAGDGLLNGSGLSDAAPVRDEARREAAIRAKKSQRSVFFLILFPASM